MQSLSWLLDKQERVCLCEQHCCFYTFILLVCLSPEEGQFQPVCPKVLVKCKSSNIQHENVGEWFEFLRQISFVNIAIVFSLSYFFCLFLSFFSFYRFCLFFFIYLFLSFFFFLYLFFFLFFLSYQSFLSRDPAMAWWGPSIWISHRPATTTPNLVTVTVRGQLTGTTSSKIRS